MTTQNDAYGYERAVRDLPDRELVLVLEAFRIIVRTPGASDARLEAMQDTAMSEFERRRAAQR